MAEDTSLEGTLVDLDFVSRVRPSFTRGLRSRGLRPPCEPCHPAAKRPVAVIEHPPAQEVPWDWLEVNKLTRDGRLAVRIVGGQDPATGLEPRTAS
jgi:hypothetical protein